MRGFERRAFQTAVAAACLVPIGAGAAGVLMGPRMMGAGVAVSGDLDSHFRYLSGLLLGIGLAFVSTIPRIETRGERFLLLACIVFAGGLGRLLAIPLFGPPPPAMAAAAVMELIVTPGLALWQRRVARLGR